MQDASTQKSRFNNLLPFIIPAVFLILWTFVSESGLIPNYLLPHPLEIGKTGYAYIFGKQGEAPYAPP